MITKEMINKLKDFNLNTYESKIWLALLMKGSATAGSLSEMTDVPRSRCYDVLESLEKKGFIIMKVGRPIKYMAVSPIEAIERTKQRLRKDAEERVNMVESIKNTSLVNELNNIHNSGMSSISPEELTGIIKSGRNIRDHLSYMIKTAGLVLLSSDSEFLKQNAPLIMSVIKNFSKKPVIRILTEKADLASKEMKELAKVAEIRNVNKVKQFCVTDKQAAIFLSDNADSEGSLLWINSEYSVSTLKDLFEAKWAMA